MKNYKISVIVFICCVGLCFIIAHNEHTIRIKADKQLKDSINAIEQRNTLRNDILKDSIITLHNQNL